MTKNKELQFESNEVKVYVQQLQAENNILRQSNDEKNELLIKLGCPTKATAKRKVFTLEQQLKRKEQECEELKKELDFQKNMYECARADEEDKFEEILELKQTLAEIKEIAENNLNIHSCAFTGCGYDLITKQILQKISECEGNNG